MSDYIKGKIIFLAVVIVLSCLIAWIGVLYQKIRDKRIGRRKKNEGIGSIQLHSLTIPAPGCQICVSYRIRKVKPICPDEDLGVHAANYCYNCGRRLPVEAPKYRDFTTYPMNGPGASFHERLNKNVSESDTKSN